jgi:hypothetical protein
MSLRVGLGSLRCPGAAHAARTRSRPGSCLSGGPTVPGATRPKGEPLHRSSDNLRTTAAVTRYAPSQENEGGGNGAD